MRGRRTEVAGRRGRGRGRGNRRNRSPSPSRIKEHRSLYRKNPPLSHGPYRCSLSPPADRHRGPCQSVSPLTTRPRRSPAHWSPLIEQLYTMRRSEQQVNRHWPNSNNEDINLQHNYMLPEHPTDLGDVHSLLKPSRTIKDKDLVSSSSSGIDNQGMLVQRSLLMDDGSTWTFYKLQDSGRPPFDYTTASLNPLSDNVRSIGSDSCLNVGMSRYDQQRRDFYDDKEREKLYPTDVSFSVTPPLRPFVGTSSSSFSKDPDLLRLYGQGDGI